MFENVEKRKIKSVDREITTTIEKWATDGVAITHDDEGKIIFVRYVIPGEKCRIKIYKEAKDYALGEPLEVLEPAANRIAPSCPHFSLCGGCDFQMLTYENQISTKIEILKDTFERIGNITLDSFGTVIESPRKLYYRNTTTFKANPKRKIAGFFRKDTRSIIDLEECQIADHNINKALVSVKNQAEFPPHNFKVRSTSEGDTTVNWVKSDKYDDKNVYEKITVFDKTLSFKISKDSFFQVNNSVIPLWMEKIIGFLDKEKNERVLDLYCGIGLITLFVSFYAAETIGVEIAKSSVSDAKKNIKYNDITNNVQILLGAVEDILPELGKADVMIVDPPRKGLDDKTRNTLLEYEPGKIIYSSCKASTMARDISLLQEKYNIKEIIPVDMFPQTHHIEVLALLTKK